MMIIPSIYIATPLGFPGLGGLPESIISTCLRRKGVQLSRHDRGQAKHRNREWEGGT